MITAEGTTPANVPGQRIIARVQDADSPGRLVEVSVPHTPYERWIDDAGNVCNCPVKTNRVHKKGGKGSVDDGNYQSQVTNKAFLAARWVRFDDGLGRDHSRYSTWTPEARQKLIDERQQAQAARGAAESKAFLDKQKQQSEEIAKAMTNALQTFADGQKDRERRALKKAELDK